MVKWYFDDLGGAGNIGYKLSTLNQAVTTQFLIIDDDKAGREADRKAKLAGLDDKYRFTWRRPPQTFASTELEDLIDPNLYWCVLESKFGVKLDQAGFIARKDSWSERMKATYENGGKRWSSSVEGQMKDEIARAAAEDPAQAVIAQSRGTVDNIVGAIVAVMESG
jgi:putative ATP-dependent endonuclease of the OLD family